MTTVGVCAAAFAALTTVLIRHGVIDTVQGETPGLFEVEALYLWHLVDAVPILGITDALHWPAPVTLSDPSGGALLLSFKMLLLIPLVGVLLASLRLVLDTVPTQLAERFARQPDRWETNVEDDRRETSAGGRALTALALAPFILLTTAVELALLELVVRRASFVEEWVDTHVPGAIHGFGHSVSISWLPQAIDVAGAGAMIALTFVAFEVLEIGVFVREHSRTSTIGVAGLVLWLFCLSLLAATAVTLMLLHAGVAKTTTPLTGTNEIGATLDWFSWHLAESIPALDVANTLGWTVEVQYVDPWTGTVLVAMRAIMVAILLLPLMVVSRLLLARAARRLPRYPQVNAAREFSRRVGDVQTTLDASESHLRGNLKATFPELGPSYGEAQELLEGLDRALAPVAALLGEGRAYEAGKHTIAALNARAATLASARRELPHANGHKKRLRTILANLESARVDVEIARTAYQSLVTKELAQASDMSGEPLTEPKRQHSSPPPAGPLTPFPRAR
ncbi:hypothetical protein [Gordonia rhizosphera]|uniref:hypothetical protein n=1 Tax=Gordonia rhizosphera TaxID=83341 RepID=UPI0012F6EFCB|nr:hypothetical protein [Gordonia rhizosphera]